MKPVITECDLQSYVDEQLDPAGRLEVADYLVRNPDVAARVLADLGARDAMRALADAVPGDVPTGLGDTARRLETALTRMGAALDEVVGPDVSRIFRPEPDA